MLMNCELLSLPLLFILQAQDHDNGEGDDPHGLIAEYYHNTTLMASVYCNELSNPGSEAWNFDDGSGGCIGLKVKRTSTAKVLVSCSDLLVQSNFKKI